MKRILPFLMVSMLIASALFSVAETKHPPGEKIKMTCTIEKAFDLKMPVSIVYENVFIEKNIIADEAKIFSDDPLIDQEKIKSPSVKEKRSNRYVLHAAPIKLPDIYQRTRNNECYLTSYRS